MPELADTVDALKAAGESTRLRLLSLLAQGELTVKDVTDILGQSQPRISRHLKLLVGAGLVERHAEGAWAYFRLSDRAEHGGLAHFVVELVGKNDPQVARDLEALTKLRTTQQSQADNYFSRVADDWDGLRKIHVPEAAVEDSILQMVGEAPVSMMLDLGTGTGRMLELLRDRFHHGVGIDSSREMLSIARAKLSNAETAHAQVRLGDLVNLDLNGEKADLIVLHQVLHYFDDPQHVLSKAAGALSDGGRMLVVDFAPHGLEFLRDKQAHRRLGLSKDQMHAWCRSVGLRVSEVRLLPPHNIQDGTDALTVCLWILCKSKSDV